MFGHLFVTTKIDLAMIEPPSRRSAMIHFISHGPVLWVLCLIATVGELFTHMTLDVLEG